MFDEGGPVFDGAHEGAAVDVVVFLPVSPFGFKVVDFKGAVVGDPDGLDGGEVDAFDLAGGVLVGKVDGPNTCGTSS